MLKLNNVQARVSVAAMLMVAAMAQAVAQTADTPESSIAEALAKVLLIIAAGGAALIGVALAKVGWSVGAKWISRIGGRG